MPAKIERAVWDSCVIIDAIQKTPGRYELIKPFLLDAQEGRFQIVVSEGTVGEVSSLSGLDASGITGAEQRRLIETWLDNPYIVRRTVHPAISRLASELGEEYGIKRLGDRLIVATAVFDKIPLVHTFDGYGESKPGLLALDNQIGSPPLRITIPRHSQGTLFEVSSNA